MDIANEMRKNHQSIYSGDQETIQVLNAELHTLKEEMKREKALSHKEIDTMKTNFEKTLDLAKKQLSGTEKYCQQLEHRNEEMSTHIDKIKDNNDLAVKTIKAEANKKNKIIKEKVEILISENKKIKEDFNEISKQMYQREDEVILKYKGLVDRFERMTHSFDDFIAKSTNFHDWCDS